MSSDLLDTIGRHFEGLYRDRENGWLLGVCAGLADRYRLNVSGVRLLAAVLLVFFTVPAAATYIALGLVLRDRRLRYRGDNDERGFWRYEERQGEEHRGRS